jgi:hypothetical protein
MKALLFDLLIALALTSITVPAWATDGSDGTSGTAGLDADTRQLWDSQHPNHTTVYPNSTKVDSGHSTNTVTQTDVCSTTSLPGAIPCAGTDGKIDTSFIPASTATATITASATNTLYLTNKLAAQTTITQTTTATGTATGTATSTLSAVWTQNSVNTANIPNSQTFTTTVYTTATGTTTLPQFATGTVTGTVSFTHTFVTTMTTTVTYTGTASATGTGTGTGNVSGTNTATGTGSFSSTATKTATNTDAGTWTRTGTNTSAGTLTITVTATNSTLVVGTDTVTFTTTGSATGTVTATGTWTNTNTATWTASYTAISGNPTLLSLAQPVPGVNALPMADGSATLNAWITALPHVNHVKGVYQNCALYDVNIYSGTPEVLVQQSVTAVAGDTVIIHSTVSGSSGGITQVNMWASALYADVNFPASYASGTTSAGGFLNLHSTALYQVVVSTDTYELWVASGTSGHTFSVWPQTYPTYSQVCMVIEVYGAG